MLTFHKKYQSNVFSQNGEDGILKEVLHRIGISSGVVVEFGAHDGKFCSNSRNLILQGWKGVLIEADGDLYNACEKLYGGTSQVQIHRAFVMPENVNALIPDKIDVLSIDVDGIDYHIWDAYKGDAKIVIIEINSSLDPLSLVNGDVEIGSSYSSMLWLGVDKGYYLLCHCGNMIFVKAEYILKFPELRGSHPINEIDQFFNTSWR